MKLSSNMNCKLFGVLRIWSRRSLSRRVGAGKKSSIVFMFVLVLAVSELVNMGFASAQTLTPLAVATGCHHSLALMTNGTVWAWGDNAYGQVGDGTTVDKNTPIPVY